MKRIGHFRRAIRRVLPGATAAAGGCNSDRFSMMNFARAGGHVVLPCADGAIDAGDRAHLLHLYSGIALATGGLNFPWPSFRRHPKTNVLLRL
jgi:hypothetical protein